MATNHNGDSQNGDQPNFQNGDRPKQRQVYLGTEAFLHVNIVVSILEKADDIRTYVSADITQPVRSYEPHCRLCIRKPHYVHPNPNPDPNPKSYPNLKLFNEYAGDIRIVGY